MNGIGQKLREGRERRGLTIEEVSRRMRVDVEYVQAMEDEEWILLPPGPYTDAWIRAYCTVVHIKPPHREEDIPIDRGLPLWVPRVVGLVAVFSVIALIAGLQLWPRIKPSEKPAVAKVTEQVVEVYARRNARLRAVADGETIYDRVLPGEAKVELKAKRRLEIEVPSVEVLKLVYNGVSVVPQGRQDAPRKLVFIDDEGG